MKVFALVVAVGVTMMCVKRVDSDSCMNFAIPEGREIAITKRVDLLINRTLEWKTKDPFGVPTVMMTCHLDKDPQCTSAFGDDVYSGFFTWLSSIGRLEARLDIHSTDRLRDQTSWSWESGSIVFGQCDLDVFSFRSAPECHPIVWGDLSGNVLSWVCTAVNVYPDIRGWFEYRNGPAHMLIISENYFECKKTTDKGLYPPRTTYHNYECTLNLPVSHLPDPGIYYFRFKAQIFYRSFPRMTMYFETTLDIGGPLSFRQDVPEFSPTKDNNLEIRIPITGYPVPDNYTLRKSDDVNGSDDLVMSYTVTYEAGDNLPEGTVVVRMTGLVSEDVGQYVLSMDNGIGQRLNYVFKVKAANVTLPDNDNDSPRVTQLGIIVGLLAGVVVSALCVLVWTKVQNHRRRSKKEDEDKEHSIPEPHDRHLDDQESSLDAYDALNVRRALGSRKQHETVEVYLPVVFETENCEDTAKTSGVIEPDNQTVLDNDENVYEETDPQTERSEQLGTSKTYDEDGYLYPSSPRQQVNEPTTNVYGNIQFVK